MQAMILAAGFGTRLLPYTQVKPKPLFPILNTPLLLLTIHRLQRSGFDHIVVNCHHLKDQISEALVGIKGVVVQEEDVIFGTGGGLRLALQYFRRDPVLVTNGDIYHTVDFRELYNQHCGQDAPVTLAMHDYPRFNSVIVEKDRIHNFEKSSNKHLLAFTGLHVIDPEILQAVSPGEQTCIIQLYRTMLRSGTKINVARVDDCFWTDMGTPKDYLALHGGLIKGEIPRWEELQLSSNNRFVKDRDADIGDNVKVEDWACLGKVRVGENVLLERSVVWDNVRVEAGKRLVDSLLVE